MATKILLSKDLVEVEAIKFVARRHGTTPEKVLVHYLVQSGIMKADGEFNGEDYELAPNELALLSDLGVQPSKVEIK
ncbi:MAG: hypothetical protein K2M11_10860 [Paramuribaculum sp.]|nr:hypothetical protein [Paramuribaculum sp.]